MAATKRSRIAPTSSQAAGRTGATQTIVNPAQRMRNANRASDNASTKQNQAILRKYRRRVSLGICSTRGEIVQWIIRVAKLRNMDLTRTRCLHPAVTLNYLSRRSNTKADHLSILPLCGNLHVGITPDALAGA